jgi:hypothetical protein
MPSFHHWLALTGVCASFTMVGCGADDGNTEAAPQDSSTTITDSASSGTDTSSDDTGTAMDSSSDTATTCAPDGGADAGVVCPPGQWRDFAGMTCKSCPGAALVCPTSFDPTNIAFDSTTGKLTVALAPGKTQLLSGKVNVTYTNGDCYGASGPPSTGTVMNADVPIVPSGDSFTLDFKTLDANAKPCGVQTLTVSDACCTEQTVKVVVSRDIEGGSTYVACPTMTDGGTDASGD